MECAQGVESGEDSDTHIGKNRHPQRGKAQSCKQQNSKLDTNGKPYVLPSNAQCATSYRNGCSNLARLVVHQHDIGSLDGSITAQSTHSNAYIGPCQHWCIIDAITHKGQFAWALRNHLSNTLHLVGG